MKNVLVTGAAGSLGMQVVKYLLTEGKYNITMVDLDNTNTKNNFKKYKKRCKTIVGDLNDQNFVDNIVKGHDVIIHLASLYPHYLEFNQELSKDIELNMTENLVRAINYYNSKCKLVFASTTSVYGDKLKSYNVNCNIKNYFINNWTRCKFKSEELIKDKIKDYTIIRLPLMLGKIKEDYMNYQIKRDSIITTITKEDAGYLFVRVLDKKRSCKNKIINASGSDDFIMSYEELIKRIIHNGEFNTNLVLTQTFLEKNYYSPVCNDTDYYAKLLKYQNDTFNNYLARNASHTKKKRFNKRIGEIYLKLWLRKK